MEKIISIMGAIGFEIVPFSEEGTVSFVRNADSDFAHETIIFHIVHQYVEMSQIQDNRFQPLCLNMKELLVIQEALALFNKA